LGLFLFERIDQFDRGEEAPFAMMLERPWRLPFDMRIIRASGVWRLPSSA
jgi:hypothetical protein